MHETPLGHEMCDLFAFALVLCDLLDHDHPAVLRFDRVLDEALTARTRAELSPAAAAILVDLEQFIAGCRGCWGAAHPAPLLGRSDAVQQQLAVAELTATIPEQAGFWRSLLEAYTYTGHPELPDIVELAEQYLAEEA